MLLLINIFQPNRYIHWQARGYEGAAKQYHNKEFGISPSRIGMLLEPKEFYDQLTICDTNLKSLQIVQLNKQNRHNLVKNELLPLQQATGIKVTGNPAKDKERLA